MMLKYGGWVTVSALVVPLLMVDRFAIGAVIGAIAVSHYTVPFSHGERLMILGDSMGSALFPKLSSLDRNEVIGMCLRSERILMAVMLPVIVVAIYAIEPFLDLWIGHEFSIISAPVGQILMVGVWIAAISRVPLYGLRGLSRPKTVAIVDLTVLLPYWLVLFVGLTQFGLEGAALAYVTRASLNYSFLSSRLGTLKDTWRMTAACVALLLLSLVAAYQQTPWGVTFWISFAASLLLALSLSLRSLPPDLRSTVLSWVRR
jgi:O-antigen/teichoic acid export membrane protein